MEKETLKKEIIKIADKWLKDKHLKVFFFGSRISGADNSRSDIDIGVESDNEIAPYIMGEIKDELSNLKILQKFDIVDFKNADDAFKKVALKNIEVIYER